MIEQKKSPRSRLVVGLGVGLAVALCAGVLIAREVRFQRGEDRTLDTGEALARLHLDAAGGRLPMLQESLPMALIEAGFPPRRPMPPLEPRARLVGGKTIVLAERTVSLAHYASGDLRLTVFLLPQFPGAIPADAARVVRRGVDLRMLDREGVSIALWSNGAWITAVATEAPPADRDALIELVRLGQGS